MPATRSILIDCSCVLAWIGASGRLQAAAGCRAVACAGVGVCVCVGGGTAVV